MAISKFEVGKWYCWTGGTTRPKAWNLFGYMDAMLDGAPHKVVRIDASNPGCADFEQDPRWVHYDGDERHDTWLWAPSAEYFAQFEEVAIPFTARKRVLVDGQEVAVKTATTEGMHTADGRYVPWADVSERSVKLLPTQDTTGIRIERWQVGTVVQFVGRKDSYPNLSSEIVRNKGPYIVTHSRNGSDAEFSTPDGERSYFVNGSTNLFRDITATCGLPTKICPHCGKHTFLTFKVRAHDVTEEWCSSCYEDHSAECVACSVRQSREEMTHLGHNRYTCAEHRDRYAVCADCGDVIDRHRAVQRGRNFFCRGCARTVHDYNYKPSPIFIGSGTRFYGMELEMENTTDEIESWLYAKSDEERVYYLKHDGSLDNGFEIVTHPHSIEAFMEARPYWEEVSKYVVGKGMRSHEARQCGLHFHVSRKGIGANESERLRTIERVIFLYEKFFPQFLKLSRRTEAQLSEWADRYLDEGDCPDMDRVRRAICDKDCDKYRAINLCPEHTIEFRLFRGTLKIDTLMASIQLIDNWINVAMGTQGIETVTLDDIINQTTYPELSAYAKERGVIAECVSSQ